MMLTLIWMLLRLLLTGRRLWRRLAFSVLRLAARLNWRRLARRGCAFLRGGTLGGRCVLRLARGSLLARRCGLSCGRRDVSIRRGFSIRRRFRRSTRGALARLGSFALVGA